MLLDRYDGWGRSIPDDPAQWQMHLFPLIRGIRNSACDGRRNLTEIAAQLRLAAELFPDSSDTIQQALDRIPRSATEERTPDTWKEIADHVDNWDHRIDDASYLSVPLTTRELLLRFPRFDQILPIYFGQDGVAISDDMQDATTEEGIRMYIRETHPRCPWEMPSVVSECYQAIALFHTEYQMDQFFCHYAMGGGAGGSDDFMDFFPLFARLCIDHLKEAHSPLWEPTCSSTPIRRRPAHNEPGRHSFLEGAHRVLDRYDGESRRIPDDPGQWQAELFPLLRGTRRAELDGGRKMAEIARELRVAGDLYEQFPDGSHPDLLGIPQAATRERTPDVLRQIARHMEEWDSRADRRSYAEVPFTARELLLRFPRLEHLLPARFGHDGVAVSKDEQGPGAEERIRLYIAETHPHCPWELPSVVSECSQAIAMFHTEEQMDQFFYAAMGADSQGAGDFMDLFPLLARLCIEHLKEAHSPLWEPQPTNPRTKAD
ncbi:hypothetical protein SUDANB70_03000 [Streptomyces sp. enrichment culture]